MHYLIHLLPKECLNIKAPWLSLSLCVCVRVCVLLLFTWTISFWGISHSVVVHNPIFVVPPSYNTYNVIQASNKINKFQMYQELM